MSIKPACYYNFLIGPQRSFQINEMRQKQKGENALTSLLKIESILRNKLTLANPNTDVDLSYEDLTRELTDVGQPVTSKAVWLSRMQQVKQLNQRATDIRLLKDRAKKIREGYFRKSSSINCLCRFFGKVSKKEATVNEAFLRIFNYNDSPVLIPHLSKALTQGIVNYLSPDDLKNCARVNKDANAFVKVSTIQYALALGYQGNNLREARNYLSKIFLELKDFKSYLPKRILVFRQKKLNLYQTLLNFPLLNAQDFVKIYQNLGFYPFIRVYLMQLARKGKVNKDIQASTQLNDYLQSVLSALLPSSTISSSYMEQMEFLLLWGANPDTKASHNRTGLELAAEKGHIILAKLFLLHGSTLNSSSVCRPLLIALKYNRKPMVHFLLESGANKRDALHFAVKYSDFDVLKHIVRDDKSLVNQPNIEGLTPLQTALNIPEKENHVRELLQLGADPNFVDVTKKDIKRLYLGNTPLMSAIKSDSLKHIAFPRLAKDNVLTEILLDAGADLSVLGAWNATALHVAACFGNNEIIELCHFYNNVNAIHTREGMTALMFAAAHGHASSVRLLLKKGADRSIKDANGLTAFDHAQRRGFDSVAAILR